MTSRTVHCTNESIKSLTGWTYALIRCVAINSASGAYHTSDSIPSWWNWTLARLCIGIPSSSVRADYASESIPELSSWADACLRWNIPNSSIGASVKTLSSIPSLWGNTSDTGFTVIIGCRWAVSNTIVFEENWISFTIWAWASQNKDVVKAQISVVAVGFKFEWVSTPRRWYFKVGSIIIEDKSIESVKINHIWG